MLFRPSTCRPIPRPRHPMVPLLAFRKNARVLILGPGQVGVRRVLGLTSTYE